MKWIVRLLNLIPYVHAHTFDDAAEDRAHARKHGRPYRGHWFHRRAWLRLGQRCIGLEVCTRSSIGFSFEVDPSEWEVQFHGSIGILSAWLTFTGFLPRFMYPAGYSPKAISLSIHDRTIWFSLWAPTMEFKRGDRNWSFNPGRFIFGRWIHSEVPIETVEASIAFPERTYALTIKRYRSEWRRSRFPFWPFKRELIRATIEPDIPVPVPGKGENSWDCGDDAISSSTAPVETVGEAIGSFYESIRRPREKYGSGMSMYANRKAVNGGADK